MEQPGHMTQAGKGAGTKGVEVPVDAVQFERGLVNLINNAIDASEKGGRFIQKLGYWSCNGYKKRRLSRAE